MELSTIGILRATIQAARQLMPEMGGLHLDIGSGHGELIQLLREEGGFRSSACDYTSELMRLPGVSIDVVDLNNSNLPYADESFDLITCTEVVEHIEHYRSTLREAFRVLRPNGVLVVTTPNILNMRSRLRYMLFGFYNLFGPLHVRDSRRYSTGGHINPVSYFYLSHGLLDAGFTDLKLSIDKLQRGTIPLVVMCYPFIRLFGLLARRTEAKKYGTIDEFNKPHVVAMNSWEMLLGRTIIVACRKPAAMA